MSQMFATAGSKFEIGPEMAFGGTDLTAAAFASTGWTEIGGTTDLGSGIGDTSAPITSNRVGEKRVRKMKGSRNAGQMTVVYDVDSADAGQIALIAAERSDKSYAFRLTLNDAPTGGKPSQRLFIAYVMTVAENFGQSDSVVQSSAQLEIDSNVVRVPATRA